MAARDIPVKNMNVNPADIESVADALSQSGHIGALFVDRLDRVYAHDGPERIAAAKNVLRQLSHIGGDSGGRLWAIVSGGGGDMSSDTTLQLMNRTYTGTSSIFPAYHGHSIKLNATKYSPHWIQPFFRLDDFEKLVQHLLRQGTIPTDGRESELSVGSILWRSGGNPRRLETILFSTTTTTPPPKEDRLSSFSPPMSTFLQATIDLNPSLRTLDIDHLLHHTDPYTSLEAIYPNRHHRQLTPEILDQLVMEGSLLQHQNQYRPAVPIDLLYYPQRRNSISHFLKKFWK